ncbi:MAG TPA: hypothetical protein VFI08_09075 [Spirochaetia bacterium]|nr:hypothetical protein [Spirochaetia bacterium]
MKRSLFLAVALIAALGTAAFCDDLFTLAKSGTNQQVSAAVKAGGDPNAVDATGATPMMYAAQYNKDASVLVTLYQAGGWIDDKVMALSQKNPNMAERFVCQQLYGMQSKTRKPPAAASSAQASSGQSRSTPQAAGVRFNPPSWLSGEWNTKDDGNVHHRGQLYVNATMLRFSTYDNGNADLLAGLGGDPSKPLTESTTATVYTLSGTGSGARTLTFTKIDAAHITVDGAAETTVALINHAALTDAREKANMNPPDFIRGQWSCGGKMLRIFSEIDAADAHAPDVFIDDTQATLTTSTAGNQFTISGLIHGRPARWVFTKVDEQTLRFDRAEEAGTTLAENYSRSLEMEK